MIDILDKKLLESTFADDFASPYFPILAELYLNEGDLSRAHKVCEVGLDHDSTNIDGNFIFAKVALAEEKFTVAEKWPKNGWAIALVGGVGEVRPRDSEWHHTWRAASVCQK